MILHKVLQPKYNKQCVRQEKKEKEDSLVLRIM